MPSRTITLLLILSLLGLSCQNEKKSTLNGAPKKLVPIYVDLLEIQQNHPPSDPAYLDSCRVVFSRYNVSQSDYDQILKELNQKPERWELFYQEVLHEIDRREAARLPNSSPTGSGSNDTDQ